MKVTEIDRCNYCDQAQHCSVSMGDYKMNWIDADGNKKHGTLGRMWGLKDYDSHLIYTRGDATKPLTCKICKQLAIYKSTTKNLTVTGLPVYIHKSRIYNTEILDTDILESKVQDSVLGRSHISKSTIKQCKLKNCVARGSRLDSVNAFNITFINASFKGDLFWKSYHPLEVRGDIYVDCDGDIDEYNIFSKLKNYEIQRKDGVFSVNKK